MRIALCVAALLIALPALAAEPVSKMPTPPKGDMKIAPPPSPPPVTWEVWGYKLVNNQWVKQKDYCLETTDLKKAGEYSLEIMRFQNWIVRDNLPAACVDGPTQFAYPSWIPLPTETPPIAFTVWAFKLTDGKWIKDAEYCWTTGDTCTCRLDALAYVKKINAVPGWYATTNAPDCAVARRTNDTVMYHGPAGYDDSSGPVGYSRGGYPVYSEHGGRTIERPHMTIRVGADADWYYRHTPHPTSNDP